MYKAPHSWWAVWVTLFSAERVYMYIMSHAYKNVTFLKTLLHMFCPGDAMRHAGLREAS
jgi:hypothetical protein